MGTGTRLMKEGGLVAKMEKLGEKQQNFCSRCVVGQADVIVPLHKSVIVTGIESLTI
jgi:hypothetical protein